MEFKLLSDEEKTGLVIEFILNAEIFNTDYNHEIYDPLRLVKDDETFHIFELYVPKSYITFPGRTITKLTREFVSQNVGQDTINEFNRLSCIDQYVYIFKYLATFESSETIFFCDTCFKREPAGSSIGEYYFCKVKGCLNLTCEDCHDDINADCNMHKSLFEILRQRTLL